MNNIYDWYYNPNFVNQQNYWQHQNEIMQYQLKQEKEVIKAQKAMNDFLNAVENLDPRHRDQLGWIFVDEIAKRCNWNNNNRLY